VAQNNGQASGAELPSEAIHRFWFGPLDKAGAPAPRYRKRWFSGGVAFDAEIRERFGTWVERALAGELDPARGEVRAELALVLLLDQFTRNCFRGEARAFAGDARALEVVRAAIDAGRDQSLLPVERSFFYLPFEHSEDLADQDRAVQLFETLRAAAPEALHELLDGSLSYAIKHREIIRRFGRFPYRNQSLCRTDTAQERAWLADGGPRFGQ
jgi:uncharacterized protein (DUF924 family)